MLKMGLQVICHFSTFEFRLANSLTNANLKKLEFQQ